MAISKTDFMRGMQCPKMLWLDRHKRYLRVIPPEVQARMDSGTDFGIRAKSMFGDYEEMTVYKPGTHIPDVEAMIAKTADHIRKGTKVICEAAFSNYKNYCAVDILRKTDAGYDIYEVKNSAEVRDEFIRDAGFQNYIVSRCKIEVGRVFVVTHGSDEASPFVINDVTVKAKGYYKWINDNIWDLNRMQKQQDEYVIAPGEQCDKPYRCWYYDHCHLKQDNTEV